MGARLRPISMARALVGTSCLFSLLVASTGIRAAESAGTPNSAATANTTAAAAPAQGRAAAPPPSRPDRSLYLVAEKLAKTLSASARLKTRQYEWDKVVNAYRLVVHKYPRSPYCDDALLKAGDHQREIAARFKKPNYLDLALTSYGLVVSEYPGSSLGEASLFNTYEILTEKKQTREARQAAEKYLAAYPKGKHAADLTRALAPPRATPSQRAAEGKADDTVQVFGIRFWSGETSTRVVVDLDRKVEIKQARLQSPPRLFVDLIGTRLHPNLVGKAFPVGNAFLQQIRVGVNREDVVRVVIDFEEATDHNMFFLADPARLVIDIKGDLPRGMRVAGVQDQTPPPDPSGHPAPTPEVMEDVEVTQPTPVLPVPVDDHDPTHPASSPTPAAAADAGASVGTSPAPAATPAPRPTPAQTPTATPVPPARNRDGTYSLARQLGLGARRICIDAGHGGHDPGAIGRGGTQEKDITLAVVLKLEKLIRTKLGADVVLTRDSDVFIPLEERTAIANASGADMFLSVHINSARNRTGRGLETYYLSFAKSAAAEELAARENAISQATMKDLNNLVKAIATNSKIDESRDFAGIIQKSAISGLSPSFKGVLDRGVHTAPFYVLIGANMPSVLTEVGFISHPQEEVWLKSSAYQDTLAESLLEGVRSYLTQLNQSQNTRLEGREGVRVPVQARPRR